MQGFQRHQRFWDERYCREIKVIDFNGFYYWCKVTYPTPPYTVDVSWFTKHEMEKFQIIN